MTFYVLCRKSDMNRPTGTQTSSELPADCMWKQYSLMKEPNELLVADIEKVVFVFERRAFCDSG